MKLNDKASKYVIRANWPSGIDEGQRRISGVNVGTEKLFLWVDLVEAADKRIVETEMEIVEARLSVPFLSGKQVVDNRRIIAGPAHKLPVRQKIVSGHASSSVFEDQPRRSRIIGYGLVIFSVADETGEAAGAVNVKGSVKGHQRSFVSFATTHFNNRSVFPFLFCL